MSAETTFDDHQAAWADYTASPWARIRYAVVRQSLTESLDRLDTLDRLDPLDHLDPLGRRPLRILDVGGGDAQDALPLAAAGHDVTVLDPSASMLSVGRERAAAAGLTLKWLEGGIEDLETIASFDVVLCHFVLQYRTDLVGDLKALVQATRPGGLVSVIAPNPASTLLTRLLRDCPAEAIAELDRATIRTVTFDCDVRKLPFADVATQLESLGCAIVGRYGGRIANDLVVDDALKHDPDYYAELERLELLLCDQEPFWRVGAFWQLVAQTTS